MYLFTTSFPSRYRLSQFSATVFRRSIARQIKRSTLVYYVPTVSSIYVLERDLEAAYSARGLSIPPAVPPGSDKRARPQMRDPHRSIPRRGFMAVDEESKSGPSRPHSIDRRGNAVQSLRVLFVSRERRAANYGRLVAWEAREARTR